MEKDCNTCKFELYKADETPCKDCGIDDRGYWMPKPQTNADRIRAMSDEELGIFLAEWAEKPWAWKKDGEGECLAWLKQPAE